MDKTILKSLKKIQQKEDKLLQKTGGGIFKPITDKVEGKIPPELYSKLQQAFYLGFKTVFEKGNVIIEKTYDKEELELHHQVYDQSFDKLNKKKSLKGLNKLASQNNLRNLSITAVEGSGLGLLGIGLPDIPVFIGVVLKSVYEIALSYGCGYRDDDEQYFILKLLEASLAADENKEEANRQVDKLIEFYTRKEPIGYDLDLQMRQTADCFAADMLCLKFIQGLPLVGVIGGPVNVAYCKKITDYTRLKYQKRYLMQKHVDEQEKLKLISKSHTEPEPTKEIEADTAGAAETNATETDANATDDTASAASSQKGQDV